MIDLQTALTLAQSAKERAEKATPGPWVNCGYGAVWQRDNHDFDDNSFVCDTNYNGDADWIVAARTDVPALADAVVELVVEVETIRRGKDKLHRLTQEQARRVGCERITSLVSAEAMACEIDRLRSELTHTRAETVEECKRAVESVRLPELHGDDYSRGRAYGIDVAAQAVASLDAASSTVHPRSLRRRDSWNEDIGCVIWWSLPICEPPYIGTPLDDDFPDGVTHWTMLELPINHEAVGAALEPNP